MASPKLHFLGVAAYELHLPWRTLVFALGALLMPGAAPAAQPPHVPDGFTIEDAAPAGALRFPMFACFDDAGRLYVAESSGLDLYAELQKQTRRCRISLLADADGDGRFESSRVFAEQLVFPMGLVWRDGKLYVADPPDLITLEDTDGDGRADQRTVILSGFGHSDNGSLHGLTFGPDGWLYLTMGEPDGYLLKRADGRSISGKAGALLRCRPDGSEIEVVSSGFENLVEVVFLPGGEIVGTLNWYSLPQAGVRDALVHLVEGGRYPIKTDEPVRPEFFHGEALPPLSLYPAVALSGMELYRGDAFPGWTGHAFTAQFNARKVVRHELVRAGATFRSTDFDFITTDDPDMHFSDVLEDADGSLLAVDTGSWYVHHCPTGRIRRSPATGGLWRARHLKAPRRPDPRGLQLEWKNADVAELARRLDDPRHTVRERAQIGLGRRANAVPTLAACLRTNRNETVRRAAAWALGNSADASGLGVLREFVRADDDPLAPLVARILARLGDRLAEPALLSWLASPKPELRMAAAEALARCGSLGSVDALLAALAADHDAFLDHAAQFALHQLASTASLRASLDRSSPDVQRAALVLLDQPTRRALSATSVVARLDVADVRLSATAQRLLQRHPEWAPDARAVVARLLTAASLGHGQQELLRSLVRHLASDPVVVATVAETATAGAAEARQTRALEAMNQAAVRPLPVAWSNALASAFRSESAAVRQAAVRLAASQPPSAWDGMLAAIAQRADELTVCRLDALRAVVRREPVFDAVRFTLIETCLAPTNAAATRLDAMETFTTGHPSATQLVRIAAAVRADNLVAPTALIALARRTALTSAEAGPLVEFAIARLQAGWSLPGEQAEWLTEAARASGGEWPQELERARLAQANEQPRQMTELLPLLAGGDATRGQQVFEGKAACAACHRVGPAGGIIGPDLTKIGAIRAGRDLLESVVMPSASFAQNYEPFTATLPDGETFTGVRVPTSDDTVILREASGRETRLPGGAPLERARVSLMPEGLLSALDAGEIRDLFAYLQILR